MTETPPPASPGPAAAPADASIAAKKTSLVGDIDRLLRGHYTSESALRSGGLAIPIRTLAVGSLFLGAFYGASMGLFSGLNAGTGNGSWMQVVASAVKVPVLFLLTLVVTFPSLYVVSALSRSRLQTADTMRVLLGAITINLALLASLGPVAAFFTLSTDSYPFMKLLHVLFFSVSGFAGLGFLWRALRTILEPTEEPQPLPARTPPAGPAPVQASTSRPIPGFSHPDAVPPGADVPPPVSVVQTRDQRSTIRGDKDVQVRRVFQLWILIFGLVGAQMGWILRPFIGTPSREFTWFRERGSNILQDIIQTVGDLF